MPTAGDTREIADYLRFSALGCYYRWRAQISQFGQAQAGPRDLQGRLADAVTEMNLFPHGPCGSPSLRSAQHQVASRQWSVMWVLMSAAEREEFLLRRARRRVGQWWDDACFKSLDGSRPVRPSRCLSGWRRRSSARAGLDVSGRERPGPGPVRALDRRRLDGQGEAAQRCIAGSRPAEPGPGARERPTT